MTVFVIGNGESRKGLDFNTLKGKTYGSNALHRDFNCNYLTCCDKRMVKEALDNDFTGPIYTRPEWANDFVQPNVHVLPPFTWPEVQKWEQHWHCGSGLHSVHLALTHGHEHLVIVGYDLFGIEGKHNNVYKDTPNYESSEYHAVDPSHWIPQFERMFSTYSDVRFDYYVPRGWHVPKEWQKCKNLHLYTRVQGMQTL